MVARDLVEFVAMQDRVAPPVRRYVHVLLNELDVAEGSADILPQHLVMVTGNEYDPGAVARPFE